MRCNPLHIQLLSVAEPTESAQPSEPGSYRSADFRPQKVMSSWFEIEAEHAASHASKLGLVQASHMKGLC